MFASKTPRDLNHDPEPWVDGLGARFQGGGYLGFDDDARFRRRIDPRPEYDHVQHNEPNPILVDFRKWAPREEWPDAGEAARLYLLHGVINGWPINATNDEYEHAFRVISRLAKLAEKESV